MSGEMLTCPKCGVDPADYCERVRRLTPWPTKCDYRILQRELREVERQLAAARTENERLEYCLSRIKDEIESKAIRESVEWIEESLAALAAKEPPDAR